MDRFSLYYTLAVVFAAAGLFVEEMGDSEVTFWPLIALAAIVSFVAIRVGIFPKRTKLFDRKLRSRR